MTNRKQVEAKGFMSGTLGVSVDAALREYAAIFALQVERVTARFASRIKKLEAKANILSERRQKAATLLGQYEKIAGDQERELQFVLPFLAVTVAFCLWIGETFLIAPVLEGMNVLEPVEQRFVAGVIVLACATLLEVAAQLYRKANSSFVLRVICFLLSGATLFFLGWWRGSELLYAAAQGSTALQNFLTQTQSLTTVVITLLTIILPVGATLALDWGLSQLRFARGWRKARQDDRRTSAKHERVARALEAVRTECEQERKVVAKRREEYAYAFQQAYELGRATGANRLHFWQVAQKIFAVGALVTALVLLAAYLFVDASLAQSIFSDAARFAIYILVATGVIGIYSVGAIKAWYRPNALQLYEQRNLFSRNEMKRERITPSRATTFPEEQIKSEKIFDDEILDEDETTRVSSRAA